jgi:hypothetical protein
MILADVVCGGDLFGLEPCSLSEIRDLRATGFDRVCAYWRFSLSGKRLTISRYRRACKWLSGVTVL